MKHVRGARPYRNYDVLAKWHTVSFDDLTRDVLRRRLTALPARRFLTQAEWDLLDAIVARLLPMPKDARPIPVTPWIDEMLCVNRGEGFRYADMPPMRDAWRRGLAAIDGEAFARHRCRFAALDDAERDDVLRAVQRGDVEVERWKDLPASRFFVHVLLKTVAGIHYSHPDAWSDIGFGGPASPRGYVRLGFDERDPWEAREER
jgi:gluconate 2-dehydrogenase subunit 3-like protein